MNDTRAPHDPQDGEVPPLENGDRLTADEFHARYAAMPHIKKAELIDGEVFIPSPTKWTGHGTPPTWTSGGS